MASSSFPSERQRNSHIHFIQQEREENGMTMEVILTEYAY